MPQGDDDVDDHKSIGTRMECTEKFEISNDDEFNDEISENCQ